MWLQVFSMWFLQRNFCGVNRVKREMFVKYLKRQVLYLYYLEVLYIHCIHLWNTWIISNYFVNFLAFFWHNFGTGEFSRSEAHRPENSNFQDVKTFPVVTPWQTLADTWSQGPRNKESKPQMEMNVVWIARIARIAAEDSTLKWGSRFGQFQFQPSPKSRTCNDMQMRRFFAKKQSMIGAH